MIKRFHKTLGGSSSPEANETGGTEEFLEDFVFDKRGVPRRPNNPYPIESRRVTFKPSSNISINKWIKPNENRGRGQEK